MSLVIAGSLAYDHIMVFPDRFKHHILPEKIHILNVSFTVDSLKKEFGGTAGNIAYNLRLLGEEPVIFATGGSDFETYRNWLEKNNIDTRGIKIFDDALTAQAFITTDLDDNQITAFHGGAMFRATEHMLENFAEKPELMIISPNAVGAMMQQALYCQKHTIDYVFDPGQAFAAFNKEQLVACARGARNMIVNDYEWQLWKDKTNKDVDATLQLCETIIITLGAEGSKIIDRNGEILIPAASGSIAKIVDPTGCGDAFRAGVLFGLRQKTDPETAVQYGTIAASYCIECHGTQNHRYSPEEFFVRFAREFGDDL